MGRFVEKTLGTQVPQVSPNCGRSTEDPCSTAIITVLNPDQAVLIIQSAQLGGHDLYLRYLQDAKDGWRFNGERTAFMKEYPRRHEIIRLGGKPFLKISSDHSQIGAASCRRWKTGLL